MPRLRTTCRSTRSKISLSDLQKLLSAADGSKLELEDVRTRLSDDYQVGGLTVIGTHVAVPNVTGQAWTAANAQNVFDALKAAGNFMVTPVYTASEPTDVAINYGTDTSKGQLGYTDWASVPNGTIVATTPSSAYAYAEQGDEVVLYVKGANPGNISVLDPSLPDPNAPVVTPPTPVYPTDPVEVANWVRKSSEDAIDTLTNQGFNVQTVYVQTAAAAVSAGVTEKDFHKGENGNVLKMEIGATVNGDGTYNTVGADGTTRTVVTLTIKGAAPTPAIPYQIKGDQYRSSTQ